jgi:hypothetical protein
VVVREIVRLTVNYLEDAEVIDVRCLGVRTQSIMSATSMTKEVGSYLGLSECLHVGLITIDTASGLLEADYGDWFFEGAGGVFAGEI